MPPDAFFIFVATPLRLMIIDAAMPAADDYYAFSIRRCRCCHAIFLMIRCLLSFAATRLLPPLPMPCLPRCC